jgi:Dolichyl-phosphate-mannose-protein mannosyltransferase
MRLHKIVGRWFTELRFPRHSARLTTLALAALMIVYGLLGSLSAILAPVFEKPDEQLHFAYVAYLLEHGQLPPLVADEKLNPAMQEAGQPPLFYGLAAISARLLGLESKNAAVAVNPYWGYPAAGTVNDNKNRFVHASAEYLQPGQRIIYVLRALSLLLGAGAILATYGLARALHASRWLAWCAAAAVSLQPQFLYIAGSVSNDACVTFLSGAALWALVVAARDQSQPRRWLLAGLIVGLAALSKTSALWLAVFGSGLALWQAWRTHSLRAAVVGIASCLGGVLACSGWWYAHNWLAFGDPLGIGIHMAVLGDKAAWTLASVVAKWVPLEKSFWATFGWGNVELPGWVYDGYRLVDVLAAVGLVFVFLKQRPSLGWRGGYGLLLFYVGGVLASLVSWMFSTGWVLGRLLFPALVPLAVLAVAGWGRLWARLPWLVLAYLCIVSVMAPVYIQAALGHPVRLPQAQPPSGTHPIDVRFGHLARLFAYAVSPHSVAPGGEQTVTLCWEALDTTPRNYSVSLQLRGPADSLVASRNTYPGLGTFATSFWAKGDAFCDRVIIPVDKKVSGKRVYRVEVILFDLETMERLPASDVTGQDLTRVFVNNP